MPIEIKELHIRVTVNATPEQTSGSPPANAARQPQRHGQGTDTETIIAECVEQVLEILQRKAER